LLAQAVDVGSAESHLDETASIWFDLIRSDFNFMWTFCNF
jgi:hypothetical protein